MYLCLCICICVFEGSLRKPIVGPGGLSRRSALCLTDLGGGSVLESRWPKTLFVYSLPLWSSTSGVGNPFILSACNLQPGKVYRPCESSSTEPRKLHRDLNSHPRCLSRKYRTDQACLKQIIKFMLQLYFLLENCQINLLVVIPLPHPAVYLMIPHIVLYVVCFRSY